MKAIRIHEFGGPEVLKYEDVHEPQPGPGEIRIKIIAAGVNPIDWKIRRGYNRHITFADDNGIGCCRHG